MKKFNEFSKKKKILHTYLSCIKTKVPVAIKLKKKKKNFSAENQLGAESVNNPFIRPECIDPWFYQRQLLCNVGSYIS